MRHPFLSILILVTFLVALIIDSVNAQRRIPGVSRPQDYRNNNDNINNRGNGGSTNSRRPATYDPNDGEDDDEFGSDVTDDDEFECPTADGLFPNPTDCKKFFICGAGKPWSQACPPALYFDARLKFCTFKSDKLACGPLSEEDQLKAFKGTNQVDLPQCDLRHCNLPHCFCSSDGTRIPGNLEPAQTPQMILLSFSGAVNQLVFDKYRKTLGYNVKKPFEAQSKLNPNGCGIKGTFFVNHEYSNYAEIEWLASHGHEIAIHSITHRLPESFWTDIANYSQWAEEIIGQREILLKFANGGSRNSNHDPVLTRDNVIGMRAPYLKPGGDGMMEMAHDFGLLYDSSIVAPQGTPPYWPFTWDYRQPFSCGGKQPPAKKNNNRDATGEDILDGGNNFRNGRGGPRQKRETLLNPIKYDKRKKYRKKEKMQKNHNRRTKRGAPFLGAPLHCPSKPYPGLWEIPVNPLYNEFNVCPHADQCVFPSSDETDDAGDVVDFLIENFDRHYKSNRAPFQLNFHVNWFTQKNKVRGLRRFVKYILSEHKDVYFVTYQQMIDWMRNPQPLSTTNFSCPKENNTACSRPSTCQVRHYVDGNNSATSKENSKRPGETRYMAICQPTPCPTQYPWYGNHAGSSKNFKTIMQLVEEALAEEPPPPLNGATN